MTLDIDHLDAWLGREEIAADVVTAELVRRYDATLGRPGDPAQEGDVAPRLIHWCLAQPAVPAASLGPDGHPARGGFLPPVALPRRMWAGGELTFHGDLCVGDAVRRVSRVASITPKEGRTGPLCFVAVEHAIEAGGTVVVRERQDIVYRAADGGGTGKTLAPALLGTHRRTVVPTPTMLFRYSALTFNGHRIHYDRPYATAVEGYDGLVVHGPMQAALLFDFAAALRGAAPSRFAFRGASPLLDTAPFVLNADDDAGRLWTARENGPVAMQAEAFWG